MDNKVKDDDIKADSPKEAVVEKKDTEDIIIKPKNNKRTAKQVISIVIFVIGLMVLIGGAVFLLLNVFRPPATRDADFLVEVGSWQLENEPSVIWTFDEIGKGKLTTNANKNTYDFIWSLDDKVLKIETKWLYTLNNEYNYELDQNNKTLSLTHESDNFNFVAASSVDTEITEDN